MSHTPSNQSISSPHLTNVPFTSSHVGQNQLPISNQPPQQATWSWVFQLIVDLWDFEKRGNALAELSKCRETFGDLAPVLWHSFGAITTLLQETISVYPLLSPPRLSAPESTRVCNALALLQCVASHPETRQLFLNAQIPLFVYPFLNIVSRHRPFDFLRLTSLGVIGGLVKADDPNVISFLLQTEIVSLCLRIMENGTLLSRTVATFIIQKILQDKQGLDYICQTAERFYSVSKVLLIMSDNLPDGPPEHRSRLIRHIVKCYLRLSFNSRACEALSQCLPEHIMKKFYELCSEEEATKKCMLQLCQNISCNKPPIPLTSGIQASSQASASQSVNSASSFSSQSRSHPLPVNLQNAYKQYAPGTSPISNSVLHRQYHPQ